jgi:hypothetical protein
MTEHNTKDISAIEVALAARQFELEHFWRRALFFWGFIASAFIGLVNTYPTQPRLSIVVSCFGLMCSLSWTLVNRGSKYWYESWETKVKDNSDEDIKILFTKVEIPRKRGLWSAKRYSVSRLSIALSDFTFILWIGILGYQLFPIKNDELEWWALNDLSSIIVLCVTLVFMVLVLCCCWGKTPSSDTEC